MSYLDWKVGDKVVCVDDQWRGIGWQKIQGVPCPLACGVVYTVAGFERGYGVGVDGIASTKVRVLVNEASHPDGIGFDARRFRKVQPRKTDISIFTAMLTKTGVDA